MSTGATVDSGLACLVTVLRLKGVATDFEDIRQKAGRPLAPLSIDELRKLAVENGFRAKVVSLRSTTLSALPQGAILELKDGGYIVLSRTSATKALILDPLQGQPREVPIGDLAAGLGDAALLLTAGGASPHPTRFGLGWFVPALLQYKPYLAQVLVASLVIQLFALATPVVTMLLIDKVLRSGTVTTLNVLAIGLVAMAVFDLVIGSMRAYLLTHTTNRIDVELGARLFRHLLKLPLAYFEKRSTGATLSRVKELESVRAFLTGSALTVIIDLGFTVVFLAVMWSFSARLTLIVLSTLAALGCVYAVVAPALRNRIREKSGSVSDSQSFLVEAIGGIGTLKGLAVEPRMQKRWEELLVTSARASFRSEVLSQTTTQLAGFCNKIMVAAILWYGASLVIGGELSAGALIAFNMMSGRVSAPALRLAQLWQQIQQARLSMEKVGDLLNAQAEPASPQRTALPRISGALELRDIGFHYGPNTPAVLSGFNLSVRRGEVVGIVGPSGCGKTTILKLLQRLYVPQQGKVLIDGIDVSAVDPAWLRSQVGVVPQDTFLFNLSIRENIQLSDPAISMDRVVEAARLAGAHDFIAQLPETYDTIIGERGVQLSGGQRQRLAIARALINRPRILLLDEATSSLDVQSEKLLHDNLRRIAAGRTVLIVAHRLSTMQLCDRVVVMVGGKVIEQGPPAQLLGRDGPFSRLVALQTQTGTNKPADTATYAAPRRAAE